MILRNISGFKRIVRNPEKGGAVMFIPSVARQDIDPKTRVGLMKTIKVLVGDDYVDRVVPGFMHPCAVMVQPHKFVEMREGQGEAMLVSPRWEKATKADVEKDEKATTAKAAKAEARRKRKSSAAAGGGGGGPP